MSPDQRRLQRLIRKRLRDAEQLSAPPSERSRLVEKFGPAVNERAGDRRVGLMTPQEEQEWLARMGMVDRRKGGDRRTDRESPA